MKNHLITKKSIYKIIVAIITCTIIALGINIIGFTNTPAKIMKQDTEALKKLEEETCAESSPEEKKFIKWVDFKVTYPALRDAMDLDIKSFNENPDNHISWIDCLAYLATKNGGDFKSYKKKNMTDLESKLAEGKTFEELTEKSSKYFKYYKDAYQAVLGGLLGKYNYNGEDNYGLIGFSPIAEGFYFNHYEDFGNSRSYGYKRKHLGNDLLGNVGTPIVAIEGGTVEALGWNQYGGWRVGIRSFDKKRYYYYAHLRKDHPYQVGLRQGDTVNYGDVIGYLGNTGYSTKENKSNIDTPHLHLGLEIIFDESQKDGNNEIWVDVYNLVELLDKHKLTVIKNPFTKEYERKSQFLVPIEQFPLDETNPGDTSPGSDSEHKGEEQTNMELDCYE